MAKFLIYTGPAAAAVADFPDLAALLAAFPAPYAVDAWNGEHQRWDMVDEVIENYRRPGR